jgi:hypothetical protein
MIVLVTDGFSADLFHSNDAAVAKVEAGGITVFAIIVGDSRIRPRSSRSPRRPAAGVRTGNPESLKVVFVASTGWQAKLEDAGQTARRFFWPCVAGLSALGLLTLTLFKLRYTPW